ncbi:MAG: hypothetical protein RJA66_73 [Actinomycetota bacterium]
MLLWGRFLLSSKFLRLVALWFGVIVVHLWLIFEAQQNPQTAPFNDVNLYGFWAEQSSLNHSLLGINAAWVYPFVAMVPIYLAQLIGGANGILTGWLMLIGAMNFIGLSALVDWGNAGKSAFRSAAYYLVFIALLGPVAIGRIDAAATFFAILGLIQVSRDRIQLGMTFFTLGAWIKIWPVAAAIALFASAKQKIRTLILAATVSVALLTLGIFLGGNENLLSFVGTQGARGLQVESVFATFWVWAAKFGAPGAGIYFDNFLVTNQVSGSFTAEISGLLGPVMLGALGITLFLGLRAFRAGDESKHLFTAVFLTATLDLIVFNKVGSPQFELWLAVPLMAGVLFNLPKWNFPLAIGAAIALLTNLLYPVFYMDLMGLGWLGIAILTARNILLILLLVWANLRLSKLADQASRS